MYRSRHPLYEKYKHLRGAIIELEGGIGAGKTVVGRSMEAFLNNIGIKAKFFPEYVNKKLLRQYIRDMKKYSYAFQLFMLCQRIRIKEKAVKYAKTGGMAIVDRSICGDMSFARMQRDNGNITEEEWQIYQITMKTELTPEPTVCLYLDITPITSLKRIRMRGNEDEIAGYDLAYLKKLQDAYVDTFAENAAITPIIVDWNDNLNLVHGLLSDTDTQRLLALIP